MGLIDRARLLWRSDAPLARGLRVGLLAAAGYLITGAAQLGSDSAAGGTLSGSVRWALDHADHAGYLALAAAAAGWLVTRRRMADPTTDA